MKLIPFTREMSDLQGAGGLIKLLETILSGETKLYKFSDSKERVQEWLDSLNNDKKVGLKYIQWEKRLHYDKVCLYIYGYGGLTICLV